MSDVITLEPKQAGETLLQVQNSNKSYLDEITSLGQLLSQVNGATYSAPLTHALKDLANALTLIGEGVNAGIESYANAFVAVIDVWRQNDATAASQISFAKPGFDSITISEVSADRVHVEPARIRGLLEQILDTGKKLGNTFNTMTDEINRSATYWIGESGNQTRQAWTKNVLPAKENVDKQLNSVHDEISVALEEFIKRDSSNFVS